MEREFIPYEQALALKELKFDESCFGYFEAQNKLLVIDFNNKSLTEKQQKRPGLYLIDNCNSTLPQWAVSAPLYQQVFRWFREKYKLEVMIKSWIEGGKLVYLLSINGLGNNSTYKNKLNTTTYEEAEFACLKTLIEIKNQDATLGR